MYGTRYASVGEKKVVTPVRSDDRQSCRGQTVTCGCDQFLSESWKGWRSFPFLRESDTRRATFFISALDDMGMSPLDPLTRVATELGVPTWVLISLIKTHKPV